MNLCKLTKAGIDKFNEYLDQLENDSKTIFPEELLTFPGYFEKINDELEVIHYSFVSRFELAKYLFTLLKNINLKENDIERNIELWAWLTVFYFDIICPYDKEGERRPRERAAYIPEPYNYKRYYRHLLLGPYLIYRAHRDDPERAMSLLCKPPYMISEIEAQIGAYQELVTNKSIVSLATKLYFDPKTKTTKSGASGKGSGSPRRLVAFLNQLDLTWDLYATSEGELIKLLPKEFEKFSR